MKLYELFLVAAMAGCMMALGCGNSSGSGDTDPNTVCADCAPGQQREDCENDLLVCSTFSDPGARQACINDAAC